MPSDIKKLFEDNLREYVKSLPGWETPGFNGSDAWRIAIKHKLAGEVLEDLAAKIEEAAKDGEKKIEVNAEEINRKSHRSIGEYVRSALSASGFEVIEPAEQDQTITISWAELSREDRISEEGQVFDFEEADDRLLTDQGDQSPVKGENAPQREIEEKELDLEQ